MRLSAMMTTWVALNTPAANAAAKTWPTFQPVDSGCDQLELLVEGHGVVFEPADPGLLAHGPPNRLTQNPQRARAAPRTTTRDDLPGDRKGKRPLPRRVPVRGARAACARRRVRVRAQRVG